MVRWRSSPAAPAASAAAICRRFGEEGASVAVFDINQDAAEAVAGTIRESGGTARAYAVDLTSQESVVAAVAGVEGELGPIDMLVNNAGWDRASSLSRDRTAQWDKLIAINLTGALHMHHAVLPGMVERGKRTHRQHRVGCRAGRLLGRSRLRLLQGRPGVFSKTIAREHARQADHRQRRLPRPDRHGAVPRSAGKARQPREADGGFTRSIPFGRLGQPDDLPGIVVFFASDDAALHHRSGAQRFRRPDHERLRPIRARTTAPPITSSGEEQYHGIPRHPVRQSERHRLDHHQPPES